jgi:large subunit ribosomal protein L10e
MARLRKFCAYRRLERPYTRTSKFRAKAFVRAKPVCRIVRFDMGDLNKETEFEYTVRLISKASIQVRDNAIESARQVVSRLLTKHVGKNGWIFKIRVYPHHILRENPLASGAGADRMSTGMQKSFGKPIGIAAQIRKGQVIFQVGVNKQHVEAAKKSISRAATKMPCAFIIDAVENKKPAAKKK